MWESCCQWKGKWKKQAGAKLGGAQVLAEVGYNLNSMIIYMLFHMNLNKKYHMNIQINILMNVQINFHNECSSECPYEYKKRGFLINKLIVLQACVAACSQLWKESESAIYVNCMARIQLIMPP